PIKPAMTHFNTKVTLFLFFLMPLFSLAQPITEYQQFNGRYDFTAIGNTMNENENGSYCDLLEFSSADLNLDPGQNVVAAYLYWAGSGSLLGADLNVEINGTPVSAERTFSASNFTSEEVFYFGAFADVTDLVLAIGNDTYTFSEFVIPSDVLDNYCVGAPGNGTNFGGWSITIVYEDVSLPNNQLTIYDGLQKVFGPDPELDINLPNLNVIAVEDAKVGFLVWEGDLGI